MTRWVLTSLVSLVALTACGTADDRAQVRAVVQRFSAALAHDRGTEACTLLSAARIDQLESQSGQSCATAVLDLRTKGGVIRDADVFVTNAQVRLRSGERVFLGREPDGWKLSALGCRRDAGKPRDRPATCEAES